MRNFFINSNGASLIQVMILVAVLGVMGIVAMQNQDMQARQSKNKNLFNQMYTLEQKIKTISTDPKAISQSVIVPLAITPTPTPTPTAFPTAVMTPPETGYITDHVTYAYSGGGGPVTPLPTSTPIPTPTFFGSSLLIDCDLRATSMRSCLLKDNTPCQTTNPASRDETNNYGFTDFCAYTPESTPTNPARIDGFYNVRGERCQDAANLPTSTCPLELRSFYRFNCQGNYPCDQASMLQIAYQVRFHKNVATNDYFPFSIRGEKTFTSSTTAPTQFTTIPVYAIAGYLSANEEDVKCPVGQVITGYQNGAIVCADSLKCVVRQKYVSSIIRSGGITPTTNLVSGHGHTWYFAGKVCGDPSIVNDQSEVAVNGGISCPSGGITHSGPLDLVVAGQSEMNGYWTGRCSDPWVPGVTLTAVCCKNGKQNNPEPANGIIKNCGGSEGVTWHDSQPSWSLPHINTNFQATSSRFTFRASKSLSGLCTGGKIPERSYSVWTNYSWKMSSWNNISIGDPSTPDNAYNINTANSYRGPVLVDPIKLFLDGGNLISEVTGTSWGNGDGTVTTAPNNYIAGQMVCCEP